MFDAGYISELLKFDYPVIFLDFPVVNREVGGSYDIVLPEGQDAVKRFCMRLIREQQARAFGFVSEYLRCRSFYERFTGMREALFLSGLPVDLRYSILDAGVVPMTAIRRKRRSTGFPLCRTALWRPTTPSPSPFWTH